MYEMNMLPSRLNPIDFAFFVGIHTCSRVCFKSYVLNFNEGIQILSLLLGGEKAHVISLLSYEF